ncbi:SGNH/GDSL hydrolase family protein [Shimia sp. R9_3]|uniref:SGNH/GDSL hydrolase family protein n=1 Tax=Shimia sp. R9_3 TaxID=2821113 RepID=UPI001ADC2818|nr:SGNH/GDSL hydrolase family protein [Shimia sp. R9_3]MBO9401327.1 SGNH/GDSL hydrolase family protein [Shimia sp. R9_3]
MFKKIVATIGALTIGISAAMADSFTSPEILIIGDSQISFGSGPAFLEFFSDIKEHCHPDSEQKKHLKRLGEMRVGVIGVRSSSIDSWTARSGRAKDTICKVDPKWKVNAGTYGFVNKSGNKYVQIGQGKEYQFCAPGTSPLEEMLREGYYDPKLILMTFLGNSAKRWANSPEAAVRDVERLQAQLPADLPCIFMTTAPAYKKKIVDLRLRAQKNLMDAFKTTGLRCSFVPGATPETVAANQGNKDYFRLNKNGMVKDPYHPNAAAAKNFFALEMDQICNAIFDQIEPSKEQS